MMMIMMTFRENNIALNKIRQNISVRNRSPALNIKMNDDAQDDDTSSGVEDEFSGDDAHLKADNISLNNIRTDVEDADSSSGVEGEFSDDDDDIREDNVVLNKINKVKNDVQDADTSSGVEGEFSDDEDDIGEHNVALNKLRKDIKVKIRCIESDLGRVTNGSVLQSILDKVNSVHSFVEKHVQKPF